MLMSAPLLGRLLAFPPNAAAALGSCHYSLIFTLLRRQSRVSDFVAIFVFVVWENNYTLLLSTGCFNCATLKSPCTGRALSTRYSPLHFLSLFFLPIFCFFCLSVASSSPAFPIGNSQQTSPIGKCSFSSFCPCQWFYRPLCLPVLLCVISRKLINDGVNWRGGGH